ncbi:amidohydrolase [Halobacillus salinarum]|uniref:amidohydrolase n=1 Tax=Halobacillus salinarum TaxID=2932257 RepID=UPI002961FDEB|nr:amidohydrolase [Halobacillus salinarum]
MEDFAQSFAKNLINWRRRFHEWPELGFLEYYTTYQIATELSRLGFTIYLGKDVLKSSSRLGLPSKQIIQENEQRALQWGVSENYLKKMQGGHTGLIAVWDTKKSGKHLGFRFDIDALPILETTDDAHLPKVEGFRSRSDGVMHACGHDGHAAIGMGVAHFIAADHEHLNGKFTLFFQPAEEGGRGAKPMIDQGWLATVDEWYSGHLGIQPLQAGTIAASTRGFLASSKINAAFRGTASHAGMKPEAGKNALLAAATASVHLYAIPRNSLGQTRVNVGRLEAGSGRNIISDHGYIEVETRGETNELNQYVKKEALRIIQAAAAMHNVEEVIEFAGETEELHCDKDLIEFIETTVQQSSHVNHFIPRLKCQARKMQV